MICCDRFFIFLSLATLAQNQPFQKTHYPLPRTKLTSLVKGEVLSPERIAFLPHPFRFSDTSVNNPSIVGSASHCNRSSPLHKGAKGDSALPTLPNPHYPSKIANTLASLVKGRCCCPKEFGRLPEGLLSYRTLSVSQTPPLTIPQSQ